jgi:hypothetical protein
MRTIYEANDGTFFDSSEECQQHELKTKFNKYKNYEKLHEDIYILCCIHVGKNTDLPSMVAFVIDNIKLINIMITADLELLDQSEEFTAGQSILVKDYEFDDWKKKVFVRYTTGDIYPYVCEDGQDDTRYWHWKYAKSL